MLDLPELLAAARSVKGRISIVCSSTIDLKPETDSDVMPGGPFDGSSGGPLDFGIRVRAFLASGAENQGEPSRVTTFGRTWSRDRCRPGVSDFMCHYRRQRPHPEVAHGRSASSLARESRGAVEYDR